MSRPRFHGYHRLLIVLAVLAFWAWSATDEKPGFVTPRLVPSVPPSMLPSKEVGAAARAHAPAIGAPGVLRSDHMSWKVHVEGWPPGQAVVIPQPLLGPDFALRLGPQGPALPLRIEVCRGRVLFPGHGLSGLTLLRSGSAFAGAIEMPGHGRLLFEHRDGERSGTARWETPSAETRCTLEGDFARMEPAGGGPSGLADPVAFALEAEERSGVNPATDLPDHFLNPPPFGEAYEASLRDFDLLLVLDKHATGGSETNHLAAIVLERLVSVANMAAVYENQLGIRVRVQEMILIPDEDAHDDIPSEAPLADFRHWLRQQRPRQDHGWAAAVKWGQGLASQTLGLAYVASVGTDDAVGVLSPSAGWSTLAHEVGHVLGAGHAEGGLMNATVTQDNGHSFFTEDLITGKTAARVIWEHARERLPGEGVLRHPREIPFAEADFRRVAPNESLAFDPRVNDQASVPQGFVNAAIAVEEVGLLEPEHSGSVEILPDQVLFTPAPGFEGLAQFSYTLRGSFGNDGKGWLHKADVAMLVGEFNDDPYHLVLAPGQRYSFYPLNEALLSRIVQPQQARIITSPDDGRLFVIEVSKGASGQDAFEAGERRYSVTYQSAAAGAATGRLVHHAALGDLSLWPLANTRGIASRWAFPDHATVGSEALPLDGGSRRLLSAESLTPALGTVFLPRGGTSGTESSEPTPTGELRFSPVPGAEGEAVIRYVFEDGEGRQGEGERRIHLTGKAITLTGDGHVVRYLVPSGPEHEGKWMLPDFAVTTWGRGQLPVGYGDAGPQPGAGEIATDVGGSMQGVNASLYLRLSFEVVDPAAVEALALRIRSDDGFVAYLNGEEVARRRAPERLSWRSAATESAEVEEVFSLGAAAALLRRGDNILAIHGLNVAAADPDFLIQPQLLAIRPLRLARLVEPARGYLHVHPGQGIVLRSAAQLPEGDPFFSGEIRSRWLVASAPAGAQVRLEQEPGADEAFVHVSSPGLYRLFLVGSDALGSETRQEVMLDARPEPGRVVTGAAVDAGPDLQGESLTVALGGSYQSVPGMGIEEIGWRRRSGPGEVMFQNGASERTSATFSRSGIYRLRLSITAGDVTTFDDAEIRVRVREREWVSSAGEARYFVPHDGAVDERWRRPDFRDEAWKIARGGIGFDASGEFDSLIDTDVEHEMRFRSGGLYARYAFDVFEPSLVERLSLHLQVDDGVVVYVNGEEVARRRAPLRLLAWSSLATSFAPEAALGADWETFDLSAHRGRLLRGKNVLAVHGLNYQADSSDFLLRVRLTGTDAFSPFEGAFEAWLDEEGAVESDPRGSFADPDRDGLTHLVEFSLGTRPFEASEWPFAIAFDAGTISLAFAQRTDLEALGLQVEVETSASLNADSWRAWEPSSRRVLAIDPGLERVVLEGPFTERTRYFRLRLRF